MIITLTTDIARQAASKTTQPPLATLDKSSLSLLPRYLYDINQKSVFTLL